jgi:hypothetical protein
LNIQLLQTQTSPTLITPLNGLRHPHRPLTHREVCETRRFLSSLQCKRLYLFSKTVLKTSTLNISPASSSKYLPLPKALKLVSSSPTFPTWSRCKPFHHCRCNPNTYLHLRIRRHSYSKRPQPCPLPSYSHNSSKADLHSIHFMNAYHQHSTFSSLSPSLSLSSPPLSSSCNVLHYGANSITLLPPKLIPP